MKKSCVHHELLLIRQIYFILLIINSSLFSTETMMNLELPEEATSNSNVSIISSSPRQQLFSNGHEIRKTDISRFN